MNDVLRSLELPVIEALGWALLHFVWQGIVIAAVAAVLLLAMRRVSARVRYLVLCGMVAVMVARPIMTWWWIGSTLKPVVREVASVVDGNSFAEPKPVNIIIRWKPGRVISGAVLHDASRQPIAGASVYA